MYNTAEYWADKVVALTNAKPKDVYWLAQCMYLQKQYHRAVHLLKSFNLHKVKIKFENHISLQLNDLSYDIDFRLTFFVITWQSGVS